MRVLRFAISLFIGIFALAVRAQADSVPQVTSTVPPLPSNCTSITTPFTGTICTPATNEKSPAVILLGGSEGGDVLGRQFAPIFARHGYVAVSVAYFRVPGLPQTLADVPVETVGNALTAIASRSDVDQAHIALFGGSKGGELALLAASLYPQITAVIADVPSPFAWMAMGPRLATACSWTYQGKELPCVHPVADGSGIKTLTQEMQLHQPLVVRAIYDEAMQHDAAAVKDAFFALQNVHGPVLCLSGQDDKVWNSSEQCAMTISYLQSHHHPYADRAVDYADAGHVFLWAIDGPQSAVLEEPQGNGTSIALGGTKPGDVSAAKDAWQAIWQFLDSSL